MNRNQLRYFVSAAEHRSFTKAAEQYYISQTAVTQQIQQLEQTLGCELFDRSTRPVSLTSAGKSFLLDAKAILERMSRAQERVHDAASGDIYKMISPRSSCRVSWRRCVSGWPA